MVSRRRDDMWRPSGVTGRTTCLERHVDNFLRLDLPAGTSIIGFAKRWLDSRGLKMAPDKTEALFVTDRRSFQYPRIILEKHKVKWKTSIKYLGVHLDQKLSFSQHLQTATAKAIQC